MTLALAILFGLFLAYANGANDNFKGVATLYGSGTTHYNKALLWATITTFLGSTMALILAQELLTTFTGKGLVPDSIVTLKSFSLAVVLAAAATVMCATRIGMPVSTTHALIGALLGAAWLASPEGVNLATLGSSFFAPLLASPLLAIVACAVLYPCLRFIRRKLGIEKETCVCLGTETLVVLPATILRGSTMTPAATPILPTLTVGTEATCQQRYTGTLFGISARTLLDALHFLSAGMVSFARGLNDTPKIGAMLLVGGALSPLAALVAVALVMAVGGLLNAKRVAETMSHRVTEINPGQGFTANLVTSTIVILASKLGLPVSTTHVSCGALFGIGTVTRQAHWDTIVAILLAWITTLPLAAAFGAIGFLALNRWLVA
ncbi:MAG: inorganic phosphate transporter [Gammaproteobacteria bacterium]